MKKILISILMLSSFLYSKDITLNLNEAIDTALKNNALNRISKLNLQIAQAQYQQALSANYPSLDAIMYASRDKNDTIFQQRGAFTLPTYLGTAFQAFAPPGTDTSSISADLDTKARGRDTVVGQLELNYPLYTGGKISAIIEQARLNKDIAKQSIIRDKNSIIFDVKKYYYGYVLTNELSRIIKKIHKRMKFSTELTKDFLENGSDLKIKRTDYLSAKLTTSLLQSTLSKIELNKKLLVNAISNLLGLKINDNLRIKYKKQNILKQNSSLQDLIKKSYALNPDMNKINLAIKIKDEQVLEASSNNYPMVNLFGNVSHTYNSYEYGYLNKDNENSWTIGLALKLSLFDGFKTKNQVIEKKLDKKVYQEQKLLLEEGLAIQLKNEFIKSSIGFQQIDILEEASKTASENSRLNYKAYQYEMAEAEDLIQSQLVEVYVKADYLKYIHDYLLSLATIDKLVGAQLSENF